MNVIAQNFLTETKDLSKYDKTLLIDREVVDEVLKKYKSGNKLNTKELEVFRAETIRILYDTPEDEELPDLFPRSFNPVNYTVASNVVNRIALQGTLNRRGCQYPMIIDIHKLQTGLFESAKKHSGYDYPVGPRGFEIVDMRGAFYEKHDLDDFFDCYFMRTPHGSPYRAWFHKDFKGVIRYYTVSPYDGDIHRYAFDAIDLYGAAVGGGDVLDNQRERYLRHKSYEYIRKEQHIMEETHIFEERDRLDAIRETMLKMVRNSSYKHIQTMSVVLTVLIDEASKRTFQDSQFTKDKRTLFFMSTNELVRRVKDRFSHKENVKLSKTTLNNAVNILAALGFIKKLSDHDLYQQLDDTTLIDERHRYAREELKNPISYYVINDVPSAYWIEKQMNKMKKKNLTLHNVTSKRFKRAFGKELRDQVFVNKDLTKKKDKYINEKNEYVRLFLLQLKEDGYVTKERMDVIHNIPSQNVANKLWTELVSEMRGITYRRSTKALRDTLDIDTKGAVFISTALIHPNTPVITGDKTAETTLHEALQVEYDALINEVLDWYGNIFKIHKTPKKVSYRITYTFDELELFSEGVF